MTKNNSQNQDLLSILLALYASAIGIAIYIASNKYQWTYYEDGKGLVLFIWFAIGAISIYQYNDLIRRFPLDSENNRYTFYVFAGLCLMYVVSCVGIRWFTFSSFSIGMALIYIKINQVYKYGKRTKLKRTSIEHIDRIRKSVILFFVVSVLFGFYFEINKGKIDGVYDHIPLNNTIEKTINLVEQSNSTISIDNYKEIKKSLNKVRQDNKDQVFYEWITILGSALVILFYFLIRGLRLYPKIRDDNGEIVTISKFRESLNKHYAQYNKPQDNSLSFKEALILVRYWHSLSAGILGGMVYYKLSGNMLNSFFCALMIFFSCSYGFMINNILDRFKDSIKGAKKIDLTLNNEKLIDAENLSIVLIISSVVSSLFLDVQSILINLLVILVLTVYSYINNKFGIFANVLTCICVSLIFWIYPVYSSDLNNVIFLSSFAFLYMLSREFVLDDYDKEDDLKVKKTSLSIIYGSKVVKYTSLSMLVSSIIIFSVIIFKYEYPSIFLAPIIIGSSLSIYGIIKYFKNKSDSSFNFFYKISSLGYLTAFLAILFL